MTKKIASYILSYDITKGMKSIGPKGLLKSNKSSELINCQINNINHPNIDVNIIVGFCADRVNKKLRNRRVSVITNDLYDTTNQGYAIELILNNYDYQKYAGCLIVNDGILFNDDVKNIICSPSTLDQSKIIYIKSQSKKDIFNVGFSVCENQYVQHLFFNLTNNLWTEIFYIDTHSLNKLNKIYNTSMRNMFMFEIMNQCIDNGIHICPVQIKTSQILKISGIKDSNKIKEKI